MAKIVELTIDEVSLVDIGANPEAHIQLWKRHAPAPSDETKPSPHRCPRCSGYDTYPAAADRDGSRELWQCNECVGRGLELRGGRLVEIPETPHTEKQARESWSDYSKRTRHEDSRLAELLGQQPDFPEDSNMSSAEILKRGVAPSATAEQRQAAIEAVVAELKPVALMQQRDLHPTLPLAEIAKRAEVAARASAYELHPELSRPALNAETVAKNAPLQAERKVLSAKIEDAVSAVRRRKPNLSAIAARDEAHRDTSVQKWYSEYVRLGRLLERP